jgi:hypothetical protein
MNNETFKNASATDNVNHAIALAGELLRDGEKMYSLASALYQQLQSSPEIDCNLINLAEILKDLLSKAGDSYKLNDCLSVLQTQVQPFSHT